MESAAVGPVDQAWALLSAIGPPAGIPFGWMRSHSTPPGSWRIMNPHSRRMVDRAAASSPAVRSASTWKLPMYGETCCV